MPNAAQSELGALLLFHSSSGNDDLSAGACNAVAMSVPAAGSGLRGNPVPTTRQRRLAGGIQATSTKLSRSRLSMADGIRADLRFTVEEWAASPGAGN